MRPLMCPLGRRHDQHQPEDERRQTATMAAERVDPELPPDQTEYRFKHLVVVKSSGVMMMMIAVVI